MARSQKTSMPLALHPGRAARRGGPEGSARETLTRPESTTDASSERARGAQWPPQEPKAPREDLRLGGLGPQPRAPRPGRLTQARLGARAADPALAPRVPGAPAAATRSSSVGRRWPLGSGGQAHGPTGGAWGARWRGGFRGGLPLSYTQRVGGRYSRAETPVGGTPLVDRVVLTDGDVGIRYVERTAPDGGHARSRRLRTEHSLPVYAAARGRTPRSLSPAPPGEEKGRYPVPASKGIVA